MAYLPPAWLLLLHMYHWGYMGFFLLLFIGFVRGSTRSVIVHELEQVCVAAVPAALLPNDCLALAAQCVGSTGLGLAHRIVGIVALSLYFLPHMNYVRMGQRDLRQMPYSAYRWAARVLQVFVTGAVLRLQTMWDGLAGG